MRSLAASIVMMLAMACGDDTVSGASMSGTGSGTAGSDTSGGPPPGTSSSGEIPDGTADSTGDGTGTTGGTDTGDSSSDSGTETGEPIEPGHAGGTWVNAGSHVLQSAGFRLHFTFGQSTTNQNTMTSPSYRLRGGLVPAIE